MNTNNIQTNLVSHINGNVKTLQNGSSVLVRVIADKGNGKYEGSVAGSRIILNSKTPLKPGSTFIASISNQNGTVQIIPKNETLNNLENFSKLSLIQNEQISALLKSLGLPADQISLTLLKQFKQLGLKADFQLLQRIHNLSVKFKGKEKSASQLLTVLMRKGLDASEEELLQMLSELDGDLEEQKQNSQNSDYKLLNKVNRIDGNWSFYPFELMDLHTEQVLGNGCIKICVDKANHLNYLNVICNYLEKRYFFNLDYKAGTLCKVHVHVSDSAGLENEILTKLKNSFVKINPQIELVWEEQSVLEGTGADLQEYYSYKGVV